MIGEVRYIGKDTYIVVNRNGTLEKLPEVGFWASAWIGIVDNFKRWDYSDIKKFCNKHKKTC